MRNAHCALEPARPTSTPQKHTTEDAQTTSVDRCLTPSPRQRSQSALCLLDFGQQSNQGHTETPGLRLLRSVYMQRTDISPQAARSPSPLHRSTAQPLTDSHDRE